MEQEGRALRRRSKREIVIEESKPYILCLLCVVIEAGFNIISKVTLDKGMSFYVLVFYGHAFGTLATSLLAFLFERFGFADKFLVAFFIQEIDWSYRSK